MKTNQSKLFYHRNLPHYQPAGGVFFVTFRLAESIPFAKLQDMKRRHQLRKTAIKRGVNPLKNKHLLEERKRYFKEYDQLLDSIKSGPMYMENPAIASLVQEQLARFDGDLYDLVAYCIMSNHVHILIDTSIQLPGDIPSDFENNNLLKPLQHIMKRIKGPTAVAANRLLGRKNRFWQRESFDYLVRSELEMGRIIAYILNNPVKAGIVNHWDLFPFSFFKYL